MVYDKNRRKITEKILNIFRFTSKPYLMPL